MLADGEATGTIQNIELDISIVDLQDPNVSEGTGSTKVVNIPVRFTAPIPNSITLTYEISEATNNSYTYPTGPLVFDANETEKNIPITIDTDDLDEVDERVTITLRSTTYGRIVKSRTIFTIVDDDEPPLLTIMDLEFAEVDAGEPTDVDYNPRTEYELVARLDQASRKKISVD